MRKREEKFVGNCLRERPAPEKCLSRFVKNISTEPAMRLRIGKKYNAAENGGTR